MQVCPVVRRGELGALTLAHEVAALLELTDSLAWSAEGYEILGEVLVASGSVDGGAARWTSRSRGASARASSRRSNVSGDDSRR
jgi:hypothetical protein